jgi:hypothetical protein
MSDELECFRKAAELGCPDFLIGGEGDVLFVWDDDYKDSHVILPYQAVARPQRTKRINRYAAARCSDWWIERKETLEKEWHKRLMRTNFVNTRSYNQDVGECEKNIVSARAFRKKYGVSS